MARREAPPFDESAPPRGDVRDAAGWTVGQLRERLKAAQLAGAEEEAEDYARREHSART